MIRIVKIDEEEILFDYRVASQMINNACKRDQLAVTGCCKHNNYIVVNLEPAIIPYSYTIAPFPAGSDAELIATIRSRYDAGFSTITKFEINCQPWGLFAKEE